MRPRCIELHRVLKKTGKSEKGLLEIASAA